MRSTRALALLALVVTAACGDGGSAAPATSTTVAPASTSTIARATTTSTTVAPYVPVAVWPNVVSAWGPLGLDGGFVDALRAGAVPGVLASTVVGGGRLSLVDGAPPGMAIPLDALSVDPATYPAFVAPDVQPVFASLAQGEAVLGETSAFIRGVVAGGRLRLASGEILAVAAVVPDAAVAGAEVVVAAGWLPAADPPRFALVAHDGTDVSAVAAALRDAYPAEQPLRVRLPGEVPFLRHGDGVLTDARVKAMFGELAFAEGPTRDFVAWDTAWSDANIGSAPMPVIGSAECHRLVLPDLRAALEEVDALQQQLLADAAATTTTATTLDPTAVTVPPPPLPAPLLEADANLGCWNPRLIRPGGGVSRHAYGIAIDLRAPSSTGVHDPRLVEIFERHGFVWGGDFLATDPIHFEWVGGG